MKKHLSTMAYKYLRSAGLLLAVFCFFIICQANLTAVAAPVSTEVTVAKECSNTELETLGDEESGDCSQSHAHHVHQRAKKVRRALEDVFLKQTCQNAFLSRHQLMAERHVGPVFSRPPEYHVRPFYYVFLFRDALF